MNTDNSQNTPNEALNSKYQLERVLHKLNLIREFHASKLSAHRFAKERGIPAASFYLDLRREKQGLSGFIDKRETQRGRKSEIDERALTWTLAYLAEYRAASLKSAWRDLKDIAAKQSWPYPSYGQLHRAYGRLPADTREFMVHGARHYFDQWGLVQRKEVTTPNAQWQIDASELDLWALDTVTGELFHPWAIAHVDGASRIIPGCKVFRNHPNTADSLLALRTAILPKNRESHPFFGIPVSIQTDNGSIFQSEDYLDALFRMGIHSDPIEKQCPSANGKVERWFRTIKDMLLRKLAGFSGQYKGLQNAKKGAIPWPLLQKKIDEFLLEYHLQKHSTLGITPWEAWHDNLEHVKGLHFEAPNVIKACKVRAVREVARDGIEMSPGCHFSSASFAGLVHQKVTLRVLPEGGDKVIECYYKNQFLDMLKPVEDNSKLAQEIKVARLDRARELARLRKSLLKTAARILPAEKYTGKSVIIPQEPSVKESEEALPAQAPKLKTEDEE